MNTTKTFLVRWAVSSAPRLVLASLLLAALPFVATAAPPSPRPALPLTWSVAKIDHGLQPEGGTFRIAFNLVRPPEPKGKPESPAGTFTLVPSFGDGWGRTFWNGKPETFSPGTKQQPASVQFEIPYPSLPVGPCLFTGRVLDPTGAEVAVIRVPTGRLAAYDFRRDLAWMYFGRGNNSDAMVDTLRRIGINGDQGDYRFPYRWFKDHAMQDPTELYPEEVILHPEGTSFDGFRKWFSTAMLPEDGGLLLALLTEEISTKYESPAMHAARLRILRTNDWIKVPTLSRFNDFFRTDCLSWDEAMRPELARLDHPQFGSSPIKWVADREFSDVEAPMMRAEVIREMQPTAVIGPGATHASGFGHFDSFNTRGYNNMATLDFIRGFVNAQPYYGLRPGSRLVSLQAGWIDDANYFPANEHLFWAALGVNDRMFLVYGPGDGFGAVPAKPDGEITPEGEFLQSVCRTINGLKPVIMETRSRLEPAVVCRFDQHGDPNIVEALVACGIMPRGALEPDAATRVMFMAGGEPKEQTLAATREGMCLVLHGNDAATLGGLGIEPADEPAVPAPIADEDEETAADAGNPEARKAVATTNQAGPAAAEEIDLSPLVKAFPALAGVKVIGTLGKNAKVRPGTGLEEIRSGGKLLAITGPLGKGWVLFLNVRLQNMIRPNGLGGSWGSRNLSLLGDSTVPDRNAALVRAVLKRAGVKESFRFCDERGGVHPFVRGFEAGPPDGSQRYLFVVSESAGKMLVNPEDPKKNSMTLATDKRHAARLKIYDPAIKAVRDLRAGTMLPLRAAADGLEVELAVVAGQGTILALLSEPSVGGLGIGLSQADVVPLEQVHVVLARQNDRGGPLALPGHTTCVRFRDPQGREVEPLTAWATGSGPHVFSATFSLDDAEGEWTVEAEDMTDGTRSQAKLVRGAAAVGPRASFTATKPLVRGGPSHGVLRVTNPGKAPLSLAGLSVGCRDSHIRVDAKAQTGAVPARGTADIPITLDIAPAARVGAALVELRRGELLVCGARIDLPEPFVVAFEQTPYLDGDLIVTEIRGTIRTSAVAATPITIRLPAAVVQAGIAAVAEVAVKTATAGVEVPFAIPLCMSRAQAQSLRGLRDQGIELLIAAPGLQDGRVTWKPNILPLARAPQRLSTVSGGTLGVRVNNFTQSEQQVSFTVAQPPGATAKAWQEKSTIAPQSSKAFDRSVSPLPPTIDPGLYDLAVQWHVGGGNRPPCVLRVEEVHEEEWWVKFEPGALPSGVTAKGKPKGKGKTGPRQDSPTIPELDEEPDSPELPATAADRERAGWRRVVTQSVLWWNELESKPNAKGLIRAAAVVYAPQAGERRIGFTGSGVPAAIWVNEKRVALPLPRPSTKDKKPPDLFRICPESVALRKGANSVAFEFILPTKIKIPGTSLILQDPTTSKRDRTLRIGGTNEDKENDRP